jgi:hypothetical protein
MTSHISIAGEYRNFDGFDHPDEDGDEERLDYFPTPPEAASPGLTPSEQRLVLQRFEVLNAVANGAGRLHAAWEIGWDPRQMRRELEDPDFLEFVVDAENLVIESVEKALVEKAKAGVGWAVQFYLLNRSPARWKDVKRVEVVGTHQVNLNTVASAKAALLELIRERGAGALQAGVVGAIEVGSVEVDGDT